MPNFYNFDLMNLVTPINVDKLEQYLRETRYDAAESQFLLNGFRDGFDIGYRGPTNRRDRSQNIPIKVGSKLEIWEKIMKEVKLKRYAGPFTEPPFKNFIQSPIGLVPKAGGQTRLIFHLSYDFKGGDMAKSLNHFTPKEMCSVKYNDLDHAIHSSFKWAFQDEGNSNSCVYSKTDVKSAFRLVPLSRKSWKYLLMKAESPIDGKEYIFVDKCLPFGSSISCSHFQRFSDAVKHIFEKKSHRRMSVTNYLDDFLFVAGNKQICNAMVRRFLSICCDLNIPIAEEKTEWASEEIIFLGIVLNGKKFCLSIPEEKRIKAINLLQLMQSKRKTTIGEMQSLSGFLNFLTKGIFTGRAFTRRMYAKFSNLMDKKGRKLKKYHHIKIDREFKEDCKTWEMFLTTHFSKVTRPFVDILEERDADKLFFYSDASAAWNKGFGVIFNDLWTYSEWEEEYIHGINPSITYLELFALCIGVFSWAHLLQNRRVWIYCDNKGVRDIVNNTTSGCRNCMRLMRMLMLKCLKNNLRIFVIYVKSADNILADHLSRMRINDFWKEVRKMKIDMNPTPYPLPSELWLASKIWMWND